MFIFFCNLSDISSLLKTKLKELYLQRVSDNNKKIICLKIRGCLEIFYTIIYLIIDVV